MCLKENRNYKKNKFIFQLFYKSIFLNFKIVYFFFNLSLLFSQKHKVYQKKKLNVSIYKILFIFLKLVFNILELLNFEFKKYGKSFFFKKKYLLEFLFFYKFYLYNIFFSNNIFIKFNFKAYLNYLLYSIYFFFNLYFEKLKKLEEEKINIEEVVFPEINLSKLKKSYLFYTNFVIKRSFAKKNHKTNLKKYQIDLSLFLDNRTNFPALKDKTFCKVLSCLRKFIRMYYVNRSYYNYKINSFLLMNRIAKKVVPVSKIIYQRRGRIFIPLKTYYFNQIIRNSLAIKFIYNEISNISISKSTLFEQKLLIILLNILTIKKNHINEYHESKDTRKKASNRNYYLKILKKGFGPYFEF